MYNKITKQAAQRLSQADIKTHLTKLPGWTLKDGSITKDFELKDFEKTWSFLNRVAMRSHLWGHHPTILTTYNKVCITLTTHDIGGVSDIDVKLAKRINGYEHD
ncbi:phhB [Cyberlindnera jadinii]|uniref:4a-hydroxytetrahydrobiopterin dehydratase n=1 Tax=Cyberlindnera jadinii (strain ATCC 18201 / CBS 1600 / BCRC 20928 / JCM 3617 / NBRC 0987 / NRRL Y-1542) TaxID=983966 RepID=A0A0H5C4V6_CYBJN|nr:transcriptional coactivator/pterin dehydratase [Cyberlindnera jadinii NRRL Y-1542]ODV74302.1 transcriptional coactivator/pterin dehydratase [Cyberlindnera jadinii NRRL Y-1542]CEP23180.1 phhB [Cyberlindnera jadinii]